MTKIRKLTSAWAKTTWQKQLSRISGKPEIKKKLSSVLRKLGLTKNYVTGQSVTGLERTAEELFLSGLSISYSKAFDQAYLRSPGNLPIFYLENLALGFDFENATEERFEGLVARGLRTFPSLLRDRDFGENLEKLLRAEGFARTEFKVLVGPEEDIPLHTDVLLRLRGRDYRIWLYQFTSRGLPHDVERVLGRRGELPAGIHVLCPLKTDLALQKEGAERRVRWLNRRLESRRRRYQTYRSKACEGAVKCHNAIQKIMKEIKTTETLLKEKSTLADAEIRTVNGWYFYSEEKIEVLVKQMVEMSLDKTKPDPYSKVCKILKGPEDYLSQPRLFLKSS